MYIVIEKRTRFLAAAVFLAVIILCASLMAGCGDENTPAAKTTAQGQTTASTSAPETTTGKLIVDEDGWPEDKVSALIPKPGFGSVLNAAQPKAGVCVISIKDVSEKDFEAYVSLLKKEGFDRNAEETSGESILNFHAGNEGGAFVELVYSVKNEIAVITVKSGS